MKAFLLSGGRGARLRPVTDSIPKCLVPINGKPMLKIWLELLGKARVHEVLINTHYRADRVGEYLKKNKFGVKIIVSFEKKLLGSAGTIADNKDFVKGEKDFLIIYSDNLTNMDLNRIVKFHREKYSEFTMGTFHANKPLECGIAELDSEGRIVKFTEKPRQPSSDLANAGIFVSSQRVFDYIPRKRPADFGFDVLPRLVGKMFGYIIEDYYIDIGTIGNYKKACRDWLKGLI